MRFASLGSGSRGNALVVEAGQTRVMLDCGFAIRETVLRLARLDLTPAHLSAIVVTHEHADHIGGVVPFARKFNIPVWLTHGTYSHAAAMFKDSQPLHLFDSHDRFVIGDLEIEPFPVPHDAREPAQFVFGDGARRLGVLTDVGSSTPHIEATLSRCHALVLECNHDVEMLRNGPYPPGLKQRVAGRFGHLDNGAAAEFLSKLDTTVLQHIVAAHLSEKNNLPSLAQEALSRVLKCEKGWIGIAEQEKGFAWRQIA
ncbi:MBL fold metallo-hydrolase [Sulfurimicrobium lacus]|uniref:MBL fold metallo-hydrolase n=1 Tax=Sulfurimicrobium lacus TaxID=2715678 RepID=A0A6F8VBQ2_9PROT|nr:MBL fold metallo-hydrolase [Sulfurimicrobium lacus]BCB26185.1 MBL fold metallo-hydrolase [Sulfurimicrobium lacus]